MDRELTDEEKRRADRWEELLNFAHDSVELIYKPVQLAIAMAVVLYAAKKSDSIFLYYVFFMLGLGLLTYSITVPFRFQYRAWRTFGGAKSRLALLPMLMASMILMIMTVGLFQLGPDIIRYLNEAAHPASVVATQN